MFGIDFTRGTMIIITFTRGGEEHQTVCWSSDQELCPSTAPGYQDQIKRFYASMNAEVISIRKVEFSEVCLSS